MIRASALFVVSLGVVGCSDGKAASSADAGVMPVDVRADAGLSPVDVHSIGSKRLDSLNEAQAEALCKEDARRYDPCIQQGVLKQTAAECMSAIDACHGTVGEAPAEFDCRRYDLGADCNVTVDDYLACVDAWDAENTCDNVGYYLATPDACRSVVTGCPRFARVFYRDGKPPPCDPSAVTSPRPDTNVFYGYDGCRPIPSRFVILGDSIAACAAVTQDDCGPLLIGKHLQEAIAPELVVESHAVSGALVADLPGQAAQVAGGPGPIVVWVQIIGNDLILRHNDPDGWSAAFQTTFDYFTDAKRFPDGATFLLNTQYSPYDQCPDPAGGGASISVADDQALQQINQSFFIQPAEQRPDTVTYDEYADWLGHGDNANVRGCPYCGADNTSWIADGIHPNAAGYAHVASRWDAELDRMYGKSCADTRDE